MCGSKARVLQHSLVATAALPAQEAPAFQVSTILLPFSSFNLRTAEHKLSVSHYIRGIDFKKINTAPPQRKDSQAQGNG